LIEGFGGTMRLEGSPKHLKLGKSTLYKKAKEGKIPAVKIEFEKKWQF